MDDESLLLRIVRQVAAASERDEFDLVPLDRTIDVDALDTLVTESRTPHLAISFEYEGYEVEIDGDGRVGVAEGSNPRD